MATQVQVCKEKGKRGFLPDAEGEPVRGRTENAREKERSAGSVLLLFLFLLLLLMFLLLLH